MKQSIENIELEVINFVITRLQEFRRIHYGCLVEVLKNKFPEDDINFLLRDNLIKTNKALLKKGYLVKPDEANFYNYK
ncbi:MAG: hypothetical protein ABI448_14015 [Bacteroidia bacterium]